MWGVCGFCHSPGNHPTLGNLLGPIGNTEYFVHRPCALWSPEVHESEDGTLYRVLKAVRRGRQLKCSHCGKRGASLGCRIEKCKDTYHALCAEEAGCSMFLNYSIACKVHAKKLRKGDEVHPQPFMSVPAEPTPLKQSETEGGLSFLSPVAENGLLCDARQQGEEEQEGDASPRKRRLDEAYARKSRAEQVLKRVRAQQRQRAAAGINLDESDDEEHFAKREAARMQRDLAKLNPIYLGSDQTKTDQEGGPRVRQTIYIKAPKGSAKTAAPQIDTAQHTAAVDAISGTDFDDLAGVDDVVRQLREMVLLPLQYPEVFSRLKLSPPRGILFHGVPGTGKTLAARALAGACARHSPVPVTFFARKGADCLGKFVGEAERTLRLLFEEASRRAPAIIFLDELDALVPARGAHSGTQDQIHASVVSTLLSLMDGMADRGNVVVVAATNRPEDIDPALRRPGRFDREVYFDLPSLEQRAAILKAKTRKWQPTPPNDWLIKKMATQTEGFAGADLSALCTEAVMVAVRRSTPQLIEKSLSDEVIVQNEEFEREKQQITSEIQVLEEDWDQALAAAPPPCSRRHAAHALVSDAARPLAYHTAPLLMSPLQQILQIMNRTNLPLPEAVQQACFASSGSLNELESILFDLGAAERPLFSLSLTPKAPQQVPTPLPINETSKSTAATTAAAPAVPNTSYPAVRLLIAGNGDVGQIQIAGSILKLFNSSEILVLSLPVIAAEGAGDAAAGVISVLKSALARANSKKTLVLHLPRVEAWALSQYSIDNESDAVDNNKSKLPTSPTFAGLFARSVRISSAIHHTTTDAWVAFASILAETAPKQPIMILATTTMPTELLPGDVLNIFSNTSSGGVVSIVQKQQRETENDETLEMAVERAAEISRNALATMASLEFKNLLLAKLSSSSSAIEEEEGKQAPEAPVAVELTERKGELNTIEWQRAQELFISVQRFLIELGTTLATSNPRRCKAAGASVPTAAARGRKLDPDSLIEVCIYDVVVKAAQGRYLSMDEMQEALTSVGGGITRAQEAEKRHETGLLYHPSALEFAHAVEDQVAGACHAVRAALDLYNPENARLLHTAIKIAKKVADEYTTSEKEEEEILVAVEEGEEKVVEEQEQEAEATPQQLYPSLRAETSPEEDSPPLQMQREQHIDDQEEQQKTTAIVHSTAAAIHSSLLRQVNFKVFALDSVYKALSAENCTVWEAVDGILPALYARAVEASQEALRRVESRAVENVEEDTIKELGEFYMEEVMKTSGFVTQNV